MEEKKFQMETKTKRKVVYHHIYPKDSINKRMLLCVNYYVSIALAQFVISDLMMPVYFSRPENIDNLVCHGYLVQQSNRATVSHNFKPSITKTAMKSSIFSIVIDNDFVFWSLRRNVHYFFNPNKMFIFGFCSPHNYRIVSRTCSPIYILPFGMKGKIHEIHEMSTPIIPLVWSDYITNDLHKTSKIYGD